MPLSKRGRSSWRTRSTGTAVVLLSLFVTVPARSLPPGRSWTPTASLGLPGFSYLAGARLETDALGIPLLFAAPVVLSPFSTALTGFRWADSTWTQNWFLDREPGGNATVLAPRGEEHLLWFDFTPVPSRPGPYGYLLMAQVLGDSVGAVDSVAVVHDGTSLYAGAVTKRRRWVAADENGRVRLFYSDTSHAWRELPINEYAGSGVAITVLDDTTAIVAFTGTGHVVNWGIARGQSWTRGLPGLPDPRAWTPFFRPRPSGGQWLAWAAFDVDERVGMAAYRDGAWSAPETLRCVYRTPGQHISNSIELSRDEGEYPAVVWSSEVSGAVVCACIPSDSVYGVAEELEDSRTDGIPTVARDANGDVWVAWWAYYRGTSWVHTYTRAITSAPRVVGAGRHRALAWTLSEPAPGSWWTVQRAGGYRPRRFGGPPRAPEDETFDEVARVRAGEDTEMSWTDDSPPAGRLRYRIRRDCVDKRYEWMSEEATWPPQFRKPRAVRLAAEGVGIGSELRLSDASPGAFDVLVYDVQGRLVHRQSEVAASGEVKVFRLGLGEGASPLRPGIYFIQARDALGQESNAVKTVLLR